MNSFENATSNSTERTMEQVEPNAEELTQFREQNLLEEMADSSEEMKNIQEQLKDFLGILERSGAKDLFTVTTEPDGMGGFFIEAKMQGDEAPFLVGDSDSERISFREEEIYKAIQIIREIDTKIGMDKFLSAFETSKNSLFGTVLNSLDSFEEKLPILEMLIGDEDGRKFDPEIAGGLLSRLQDSFKSVNGRSPESFEEIKEFLSTSAGRQAWEVHKEKIFMATQNILKSSK